MRPLALALALFSLSLGSLARAQDTEPNDACAALAEPVASVAAGTALRGSLASTDPAGFRDVDYLVLSAPPGSALTAVVSSDSRSFPRLAVFDEQCRRIADSFISAVGIDVPASGRIILAVANPDDLALGGTGRDDFGPYTLTFRVQPPFIGSISGRLVDARTGGPLNTSRVSGANVDLALCAPGEGCSSVGFGLLDADGRFEAAYQSVGNLHLPPGTYELTAFADYYGFVTPIPRFDVAEGQRLDLGDVALPTPAISYSELVPCSTVQTQGGRCAYSLRVHNNAAEPLEGLARSVVSDPRTTSPRAFEVSASRAGAGVRRAPLSVAPGGSELVAFAFDVPAFVPNGTLLCAELFVGTGPAPLIDESLRARLFCMTKGQQGFALASPEQVAEQTRSSVP
jgi:hypothetical protein